MVEIPENNIEFAALLRRQAMAVFVACEEPVANDLSATLTSAADRLIALQRQVHLQDSGR